MITEFMTTNPRASILIVSAIITLISTLVTGWLTDQEHLKSLKAKQKELNKKLKTCKPGEKLFQEIQSEILQISGTMMKAQFKPMMVTIVPFLILFAWLKQIYDPVFDGSGWVVWYIIGSILFSSVYRKLFKMA